MTKSILRLILYTTIFTSSIYWTVAQAPMPVDSTAKKNIYYFELHTDINAAAERRVDEALSHAKDLKADYIIMSLDSYGGLLDAGDSIHIKLLRCPIPIMCFITNNAASAAALIAISCDSIYMSPFAKMGAASVVDQSGAIMPEKYQAYMRGILRSTAETNNRDPQIAQAMVSGHSAVPGVIDSVQILTMTTSEAITHNYCEGEVNSPTELLQNAGIMQYTITEFEPTTLDAVLAFFFNPIARMIFLILIFIGIYFELQHPGIGLPLFTAIAAALCYFAPLYIAGLAANWEILLFAIGIILIILEIFVVPGFGITGISGITFTLTGLVLSMVKNNGLNFDYSGSEVLVQSLFIVLISLASTFLIIYLFFRNLPGSLLFKHAALETSNKSSEGYQTALFTDIILLHKTGLAMSDLRPAGKIEIESDYYDAQTEGNYILKGKRIKVVGIKNTYLLVREIE